jgi:RNA recognition motif-containing protein
VETKIGAKFDAARARSKDSTAIGSSSEDSGSEDLPKTTVFMKNVPTSYTRSTFLGLLDREGFAGEYDLVYLPIDFDSRSSLGYAFVNLLTPQVATRFRGIFQGFTNWDVDSDKVCDTTGAAAQGFKANVERYRNSAVMHESVPEEFRPVIFSGGVRVPFPAPTRRLKAPQTRRRSMSTLD